MTTMQGWELRLLKVKVLPHINGWNEYLVGLLLSEPRVASHLCKNFSILAKLKLS